MTTATEILSPQQRLAKIVAEETDGGRKIVRFFRQVVEGELNHEGFQPNHRMDSAKQLVKIGLTEFQDYIDANASPPKRRKTKKPSTDLNEVSPETLKAREELAQYARELTQDGRTVIQRYSEIMDGLRNDEGFQPHHRIAAGKELLLRGFGPASSWPEPVSADSQITDHQPNQTNPRRGSPLGNHSSDNTPEPQVVVQCDHSLPEPLLDYLEEAVRAYEGPNPITEKMSPELRELVESDEPLDCQCDDDYGDSCPNNDECPYFHLEFPEYTEEEQEEIMEWALRGLRRRAEWLDAMHNHPEHDP